MIKQYKFKDKVYYRIQLNITDKKGKRHQPKYQVDRTGNRITSERLAKKLEMDFLLEFQARLNDDYSNLFFKEWHVKFLENIRLSYKRSTIMQYDGDIKKWLPPEISETKLSEIRKSDIHQFIFENLPSRGASSHTQKRILKTLRRIFEAAIEDGLLSRNPAIGIKVKTPPAKKKVLNTDEASHLLENAKAINHPFYHHWAIALLTGMRNGELYALRWSNIDLTTRNIIISASWSNKDGCHSTKANKDRVVPISPDLRELLIELKNLGPFAETLTGLNGNNQYFNDLVLPRSSGWKHGEQAKMTSEFCKTIGITQIKFHDLRATFITNMLSQGVPLAKVMALVGHSRTSTTDEYLRMAGINLKDSTDNLGYRLPKEQSSNVISIFNT